MFVLLVSYAIGSVSFAYMIGKVFYGKDVSQLGSGNLGGTNVFRNLGIKAGMAVGVLDISKGAVAVMLPLWMDSGIHPLYAGAAAIIGHSFSVFLRFKGGKSVATTAGVFLMYSPFLLVAGVIVFAATLKLSKYVSLSSILGSVSIAVASLFTGDAALMVISILAGLFVVFRHRSNIKRIREQKEPKVKWL